MQLKPNWENAPEWANFLAMDENGCWFWYEIEPFFIKSSGCWSTHGKTQAASGAAGSLESKPKSKNRK